MPYSFVVTFVCPSPEAYEYWEPPSKLKTLKSGISSTVLNQWQVALEKTLECQLKSQQWLDETHRRAVTLTVECCSLPTIKKQRQWEEAFRETWAVDIAIEPTTTYGKKQLLISDMDSTLLSGECIDELAHLAGIGNKVAEITSKAMNGLLDFEEALQERVALLKGQPAEPLIQTVLAQTPLMLGAEMLCLTQKAHGTKQVVVSGGFTPFTQDLCRRLLLDEHQANTLGVDEQGLLTGTVGIPIFGKQSKVEALHHYSKHWGIPLAKTIALGDGANDLGMILEAGMGVAFHAKPIVTKQAPFTICFGDLTTLLYYQGYKTYEFKHLN